MNHSLDDKARQEESQRILKSLKHDSGGGSDDLVSRSVGYLSAHDRDRGDPIELWGTRIGRWIGIALVGAMVLILLRILGVI